MLFSGLIISLFLDFAFSKRLFIFPFFKLLESTGFLVLFKLLLPPCNGFPTLLKSFFILFVFEAGLVTLEILFVSLETDFSLARVLNLFPLDSPVLSNHSIY